MAVLCQTGQHDKHDVYSALCPCRDVLNLVANKWAALAVGILEDGPLRFGTLQHHLQGVSPKVLTHTLRRLEGAGFVDRTVYPEVPLRVEYALTDLGHSLAQPLAALRNWVEHHLHEITNTAESTCTAAPERP
ncbi:MAG TPA: helix-turn-helix domain-containing protein [Actinoplanes sp.]|jgi:DNA-binding HxlR family transcriptional regulator